MTFTLMSYGPGSLTILSDDGHEFHFDVVSSGPERSVFTGDAGWKSGSRPMNGSELLTQAHRFASMCAQDFGLL